MIAEGYDQKRFLEHLVKVKSKYILYPNQHNSLLVNLDTTPNVDYFTRDEMKVCVREFKEKVAAGDLNDVSTHNYLFIAILLGVELTKQ